MASSRNQPQTKSHGPKVRSPKTAAETTAAPVNSAPPASTPSDKLTSPSAEDIELVSGGMVTVTDAKKLYRLSRHQLKALMRDGVLPYAIISGRGTRAIPKKALDEYIASLLVKRKEE